MWRVLLTQTPLHRDAEGRAFRRTSERKVWVRLVEAGDWHQALDLAERDVLRTVPKDVLGGHNNEGPIWDALPAGEPIPDWWPAETAS